MRTFDQSEWLIEPNENGALALLLLSILGEKKPHLRVSIWTQFEFLARWQVTYLATVCCWCCRTVGDSEREHCSFTYQSEWNYRTLRVNYNNDSLATATHLCHARLKCSSLKTIFVAFLLLVFVKWEISLKDQCTQSHSSRVSVLINIVDLYLHVVSECN